MPKPQPLLPITGFYQHPTEENAFIIQMSVRGRTYQHVVRNPKARTAIKEAGKLRPASELPRAT